MIGSSEMLVLILLGAIALAVVDIIRRKDLSDNMKAFWVFWVFIFNLLGIFIYLLAKTWQYYEMGKRE
jgi:hypothetical protein